MSDDRLDAFLSQYEAALTASGDPEVRDVVGMIVLAESGAEFPVPPKLQPVLDFIQARLESGDFPSEWLTERLLQAKKGVELKRNIGFSLELVSSLAQKTDLQMDEELTPSTTQEVKEVVIFTVLRKLKDDHQIQLESDVSVASIDVVLFQRTNDYYILSATIVFINREAIGVSPILVPIRDES